MPQYLLACLIGLALLAWAADQLVLGASRLARRYHVAPAVVGVVFIGFGTSSPELLVSGLAALEDRAGIALGNVIGSNLANLALVLGVAGLLTPFAVTPTVLRREAPLSTAAIVLFAVLVQGGLSRLEGLLLVAALAGALTYLLRESLRDSGGDTADPAAAPGSIPALPQPTITQEEHRPLVEAGRTVAGLLGILTGAQLLVWGAVGVADAAGLSEGLIGATLVAVGTSAPELAAAVQAGRRGETELLIGNVLGSNLFNALAVGGLIGLLSPGTGGGAALTGVPVLSMVVLAGLAWWFLASGRRLARWEGALLLAAYAAALFALG